MRLPSASLFYLVVVVLLLESISDVLASNRFELGHGRFSVVKKKRGVFHRRSAVSWLTNISSSISDWMFGSVPQPVKDASNRPKALNGGPPVLKRMLYPYVTGIVPRPANETLAGSGLAASWLCMMINAPSPAVTPASAPVIQQSSPIPASGSGAVNVGSNTGATAGTVPGAGNGVAGTTLPASFSPVAGAASGAGASTPIYNSGPTYGADPIAAGAGGAPGSAVASNIVPAGYVNYYGQWITYQQYQQLLASQGQTSVGGLGSQPVVPGSNSNPNVPAGYVNVNGQLMTQQQYAQLLNQAGASSSTAGGSASLGGVANAGTFGTVGATAGFAPGAGSPAGAAGVIPGVMGSPATVQKRDSSNSASESLVKRQDSSTTASGSTGGAQTQQATAAPPAQIMVCVNGDLDVDPIKFDTMTGVRIVDTAASTNGVMDIINLPNYKMPWMPFLPTQAMWDEQQILMLAQEHQIQYSTNVGPPPNPQ